VGLERPITRNSVVALLGTPHVVEGSLNEPVERDELGIHYNEKWTYRDLADDPAGMPNRVIYWHRYDFVATMVRANDHEQWRSDPKLLEAAKSVNARLSTVEDHHAPYPINSSYRPVSKPQDWRDLGGYVQDEATGLRIKKAELE
jgi:hypothetical protein